MTVSKLGARSRDRQAAVVGLPVLGREAHAAARSGVADRVTAVAAVVRHRSDGAVDDLARAGDEDVVADTEVDEPRVRRAVLDLVVAALGEDVDQLARGGAHRLGRRAERAEVRVAANAGKVGDDDLDRTVRTHRDVISLRARGVEHLTAVAAEGDSPACADAGNATAAITAASRARRIRPRRRAGEMLFIGDSLVDGEDAAENVPSPRAPSVSVS